MNNCIAGFNMNNGFNNFNNMNGLGGNMMLNNGMFGGGNNGELKVLLVLTNVTINKPIFIFTGQRLKVDSKDTYCILPTPQKICFCYIRTTNVNTCICLRISLV